MTSKSMTKRSFLGTTAATAAGLTAPNFFVGRAHAADEKIRVGIIPAYSFGLYWLVHQALPQSTFAHTLCDDTAIASGEEDNHLSELDYVGFADKGLVEYYSEDTDYNWANQAEAFLQNYFAGLSDTRYKLIRAKCRTNSCEVLAHLVLDEDADRERDVPLLSMKAFDLIRGMSKASGYSEYFSMPGTMSSELQDDNKTLQIYSFVRRARTEK